MRDEVLRGQEVAVIGLAALVAAAACGAPSAPQPATVEIVTPGSAVVRVETAQPPASARAPAAPPAPIQWIANEREARERARRQGVPLLVWVRAAWSAATLEMERKTWADPRVARAETAFVALRLDVTDAEGDAELLAQRYAVDTVPTTIVFDASGRQNAVLRGFADADAIVAALARAAQ